jgi:hypothetical protein
MPSSNTVEARGSKSLIIKTTGNEKMRIMCMLGFSADGTNLPPFVIFKKKTLPKDKYLPGIYVRVQEKGWVTEELVRDWVQMICQRGLGALLNMPSMRIPLRVK